MYITSAQPNPSLGHQFAHRLKELGFYSSKRAVGEQKQIKEDKEMKLEEERNFLKKKVKLLEVRPGKLEK